jgi:elongator complex protein 1
MNSYFIFIQDPKEYLPFLNEFKKHPLEFRKYRIDLHLKRHKKALKNLSEIGGGSQHATEALDLVRSQRLYKEGMEYFREGSNVHRDICRSYGDYLVTKKYYEDAALTYERGLCLNEAVGAWEKSLNWRLCLAMAQEISMHTHDVRLLCSRIVEALIEEKRYFDAAVILSEYLDDVEEAIAALVKGCCWAEAARMIRKANRADLDGQCRNV